MIKRYVLRHFHTFIYTHSTLLLANEMVSSLRPILFCLFLILCKSPPESPFSCGCGHVDPQWDSSLTSAVRTGQWFARGTATSVAWNAVLWTSQFGLGPVLVTFYCLLTKTTVPEKFGIKPCCTLNSFMGPLLS